MKTDFKDPLEGKPFSSEVRFRAIEGVFSIQAQLRQAGGGVLLEEKGKNDMVPMRR